MFDSASIRDKVVSWSLWLLILMNAGVILGVVLEEDELIERTRSLRRKLGLKGLFDEISKRGWWYSISKKAGFIILVISLSGELLSEAIVEIQSNNELGLLQTKNLELSREASPRTISEADQARMIAALKEYSGLSVLLVVYPTDAEGRRLAAQLSNILHSAGIITPGDVRACGRQDVDEPLGQLVTGVYVTSGDRPMLPRLFGPEFVSLLNNAGIETEGGHLVHCEMPYGEVEVFVGVKPIPGASPYNDNEP